MENLNQFLEQHKLPIALSLVGIILIVGGFFSSGLNSAKPAAYAQTSTKEYASTAIKVDVSGAVNAPGVYSLNASARVEEAIRLAGGFTENANKDYISKTLNLSHKISDGEKIYIPFTGESGSVATDAGSSLSTKVNINMGTEADLETLPGVGPSTAQKIISGRPYNSIADLSAKKIVSKSVYTKIQDLIEVN